MLNCINNRIITEKILSALAAHQLNLSPAGRKRFFQVYEQRMSSILTHPVFDSKVSCRRARELPDNAEVEAKPCPAPLAIIELRAC